MQNPEAMMRKAITLGKAENELDYCEKILRSTKPEAREHKGFALMRKLELLCTGKSGTDWWEKLRDKEMAGHKLGHHQMWMWREAEKRAPPRPEDADVEPR